jgi:hypothetical protein
LDELAAKKDHAHIAEGDGQGDDDDEDRAARPGASASRRSVPGKSA